MNRFCFSSHAHYLIRNGGNHRRSHSRCYLCVCVGVTGIPIVVPPVQPHKEIAIDFVCGGDGDDQSTTYCRFKAGGGYE